MLFCVELFYTLSKLMFTMDHLVGIEEGDEPQPVGLKGTQPGDEDDADGKKKEKKKKKNRGRRHKAKLAKEDKKDSEKVALAHGELHTGVSSSEVEVGCICGTSKGGFHSSSCPYPFTCSGSMVQRKIKEQYDELVRSNAAKTLTLAQVTLHPYHIPVESASSLTAT